MTSTPDDGVAYCTREMVQEALDQPDTYRLNKRIDANCRAASRHLEGVLHRRFYPFTGTRYPSYRQVSGDTLWVNTMDHEIRSLDSLTVDGEVLTEGTDFYLDTPGGEGPPYTAVRLYRDSTGAWPADQRDIVNVGVFGGPSGTEPAGALAAAVAAASTTTMTVSNSAALGVGDLVLVDAEQVVVTEKSAATTTATLAANLTADESEALIPVSSGVLVNQGETILIDSERMFVEQVAGNNLIVRRGHAASVLAAHTSGATIYAPRLCTIRRGAAGTTAAAHSSAADLTRNAPPSLVSSAALAFAINLTEQEKTGYTRTAGVGDNRRESGGTGLVASVAAAIDAAYGAYGRQGRIGVC